MNGLLTDHPLKTSLFPIILKWTKSALPSKLVVKGRQKNKLSHSLHKLHLSANANSSFTQADTISIIRSKGISVALINNLTNNL